MASTAYIFCKYLDNAYKTNKKQKAEETMLIYTFTLNNQHFYLPIKCLLACYNVQKKSLINNSSGWYIL